MGRARGVMGRAKGSFPDLPATHPCCAAPRVGVGVGDASLRAFVLGTPLQESVNTV